MREFYEGEDYPAVIARLEREVDNLRERIMELEDVVSLPDTGPWEVSGDGSAISSDDFDHDVILRVTGDFASAEQRKSYSDQLAAQLNSHITTAAVLQAAANACDDTYPEGVPLRLVAVGFGDKVRSFQATNGRRALQLFGQRLVYISRLYPEDSCEVVANKVLTGSSFSAVGLDNHE